MFISDEFTFAPSPNATGTLLKVTSSLSNWTEGYKWCFCTRRPVSVSLLFAKQTWLIMTVLELLSMFTTCRQTRRVDLLTRNRGGVNTPLRAEHTLRLRTWKTLCASLMDFFTSPNRIFVIVAEFCFCCGFFLSPEFVMQLAT